MNESTMEKEKDVEIAHDEFESNHVLESIQKTGDHDKILAAIANDILPDIVLNTDPAFEKALVRKFDRRLLMMMMG